MPAIEPTQDELREQRMTEQYGRRIIPNSPFRTTAPERKAHTEKEIEEFYKLDEAETKYFPKKPEAGDDKFFWKITAVIPACLGADERDIRINFQIQKYWRNKTYKVQTAPDNAKDKVVHEPYCEVYPDNDRMGRARQLRATGESIIDATDFIDRFKAE